MKISSQVPMLSSPNSDANTTLASGMEKDEKECNDISDISRSSYMRLRSVFRSILVARKKVSFPDFLINN